MAESGRGPEARGGEANPITRMSAFVVSPECIGLGLRAGAVVFRGVRIADSDDGLHRQIASEIQTLRGRPDGLAQLRAGAGMQVLYEAFRRVGAKPRRHPPSVERLFQFALKRGDLPAINNLVDAYNLMSLRTGLSMGAHDLDRITPPVTLRLFHGGERFTPLGATEAIGVVAGEFGYVDAEDRVLCRLDVVQAEFSKVTADARNVLLIIEGTAAENGATFQRVFSETVALIRHCCGGEAEVVAQPGGTPPG